MSIKLKKKLMNESKTRFKGLNIKLIMVYYKYSKQQSRFSKKKLGCINKTVKWEYCFNTQCSRNYMLV